MYKFLSILILLFASTNIGFCSLTTKEINTINLKEHSMYLLDIGERTYSIESSNEQLLNIIPITSLSSNGKQLFISSTKSGICDVSINTEKESYKVRFVTGPTFEDSNPLLTQIDLPISMNKEIK